MGTWKIITHPDPAIPRKFAAASPFAGVPTMKVFAPVAGELTTQAGVLKSSSPLVRYCEAPSRFSGTEVRYTEYQYNDSDRFRDLGMVTRNGHNSWETSYKDQGMIDRMFRQRRVAP
jgi:predicted peptidase